MFTWPELDLVALRLASVTGSAICSTGSPSDSFLETRGRCLSILVPAVVLDGSPELLSHDPHRHHQALCWLWGNAHIRPVMGLLRQEATLLVKMVTRADGFSPTRPPLCVPTSCGLVTRLTGLPVQMGCLLEWVAVRLRAVF